MWEGISYIKHIPTVQDGFNNPSFVFTMSTYNESQNKRLHQQSRKSSYSRVFACCFFVLYLRKIHRNTYTGTISRYKTNIKKFVFCSTHLHPNNRRPTWPLSLHGYWQKHIVYTKVGHGRSPYIHIEVKWI